MRRRLAWGLTGLALVLLAGSWALSLVAGVQSGSAVSGSAMTVGYAAAGVLIACGRPRNPIGWIFLGAAVSAGVGGLASAYADLWAVEHEGPEALGMAAAWYGELSWIPFILVPATFVLLLFPDGHPPSPRWRVVGWTAAVGLPVLFVAQGLLPGPLADHPDIRNPLGVEGGVVEAADLLASLAVLLGVAGSAASLVVRLRRARGDARQQLKWLAYAGTVAAVTIPVAIALYEVVGATAADTAIMLALLGLPAATGVAMLRHRLYDIDVVINRTLVYGALTATLVTTYLGSVLLLQLVLGGLTGDSGLAVAGSTLAVAGAFRPLRTRIQHAVDRRFYRSRYDAQRTLETFAARLRGRVDLAAVSAELEHTVRHTVQPAHVSLWLRGPEDRR